MSHGQFNEDVLLGQIFCHEPRGVCLEVGAFDGVTGSATYTFEQRGWTAILVEPLPEMAELIRARRRGPFFSAAAGAREGKVEFFRARHDMATSSIVAAPLRDSSGPSCPGTLDKFVVPAITLDRVLRESGVARLDFATIDVEGHELSVLHGWDLDRWRPRVIILEDNSRGLDPSVRLHLRGRGYVCFHRTGVNDWYARLEDTALARPGALLRRAMWRRWRRFRPILRGFSPAFLRAFGRRYLSLGD
ncbi:MAG: FkbM family methyltransferase [Opitutaceae bacterium]|jgi:FkbM family methyltransferase|nr:FkbM family methyltransferase [Opitutaceae bacterium]